MRYLSLVPTGSERACKVMFHASRSEYSIHFVFDSLSLLNRRIIVSYSKDLSISQLRYGTLICTALTMERLFSPCTRYRDMVESRGGVPPPESLRELNLNVSTDEFLSAERGFTYANLYAMLGNGDTMTWLTPHAAIMSVDGSGMLYLRQLNECRFLFSVDGKKIVARARSSEALWKIVGVVLRLVSARVVHSVLLEKCDCLGAEKVSTPPLWRI
jgi:hypothetical protein